MGDIQLKKKFTTTSLVVQIVLVMGLIGTFHAFPTGPEEGMDGEFTQPGAHQLASWIIAQLRRGDYVSSPRDIAAIPYRISPAGKRNSAELTSSIMAIPRTMIDNGRK